MIIPQRIQIQTQTGCNGRCVFCPNEQFIKAHLPTGRMPKELFCSIIDQLATLNPHRIMPYLQNEPLLDERLPELVEYIHKKMPKVTTLVVSNGTRLNNEMGEKLIESGLKRLKVSLQSLNDEVNQQLMGYPAKPVIENIIIFSNLLKKKQSDMDFRVSTIVTSKNEKEIDEMKKLWGKYGIRLVLSSLENRGGNISNVLELSNTPEMRLRRGCIRPTRDMCILFNGKVVLCCVDWLRTVILGDLNEKSITEIWNSPRLQMIREGLNMEDCCHLPEICRNCSEAVENYRKTPSWLKQIKNSFKQVFQNLTK
ncbi:MAG TPA: radical SAM protein [Candidatus Hydrogenedens sp.]|nr:radical SAM protein [Candidatus Hydrogenedens sp.]HOL18870.1 radical SAM protein [Candidatus Hydrogenedens sp.]HPP57630.1 radical SAM protein [Candidatus Hydrogenedens sp.]